MKSHPRTEEWIRAREYEALGTVERIQTGFCRRFARADKVKRSDNTIQCASAHQWRLKQYNNTMTFPCEIGTGRHATTLCPMCLSFQCVGDREIGFGESRLGQARVSVSQNYGNETSRDSELRLQILTMPSACPRGMMVALCTGDAPVELHALVQKQNSTNSQVHMRWISPKHRPPGVKIATMA